MNPMYLIIVAAVVFLVFCTIGYYLYQEARFRKMVENTFNQKTDDILMHTNKKIVFEGENRNLSIKLDGDIIQKDKPTNTLEIKNANFNIKNDIVENDTIVELSNIDVVKIEEPSAKIQSLDIFDDVPPVIEEIPNDSVEAFFAKQDLVNFAYAKNSHIGLDLVIDIVFEENIKVKNLLDIAQFTQKSYKFYVLDLNGEWHQFETGKKYVISGLKLIVALVDSDGIINQAQISNIYNALHKFVLENEGHIRISDYVSDMEKIKIMVNHIEDVELDLNLYLITKDSLTYQDVSMFFSRNGFIENNGIFSYKINGIELFTVSDENASPLKVGNTYKLFTITSKLHLQKDQMNAVDAIFDFAEKFMNTFESRILTTNKLIFAEKEYQALIDYVAEYVNSTKKYGIELGGELLQRVY